MVSNIISLESIQIATPCRAKWSAMQGDDRARFCRACAKNVYNVSAMTREEAMRLIEEKEGNLCLRLHLRSDGTVITSDCPVGQMIPKRAWGIELFAVALGFLAGVFGLREVAAEWAKSHRPTFHVTGDSMNTVTAFEPVSKKPLVVKDVSASTALPDSSVPATDFLRHTQQYGNASEAERGDDTVPV